ncbi:hypothetical protein [Mesorhizobium sp. A556]
MPERGRATEELDALSDAAVADYLRRANRTALENMIALCLHAMTPSEVVEFLRKQADFIEQDLV